MFSTPVRGGSVTAGFEQPRPLGSSSPTHIHGAIDLAPKDDRRIYAPESGTLFAYIAHRPARNMYWPEYIEIHGRGFPFLNYFYDTFGGLLVLLAHNGDPRVITRTHILTHSWGNQILNYPPFADREVRWIEEQETKPFPIAAVYTEQIMVERGQPIGRVGNAGHSTGRHVHWELHDRTFWQRHEDRMNPEEHIDGTL